MVAGIWMWNPAAFNEETALKEVNREISLGAGTFDALLTYEKNILPLVALFKTYINSWTSEFHVKTLERESPLDADGLIAYWNNYQDAERAFKTIQMIIKSDNDLHRPSAANGVIADMQKTLDLFRHKLIRKLKRKGIVIR
jgi:predicted GNAT superfamily acetyltransferase